MAKTKQDGFPFSAIPRGKDLSLLGLACALAVIGIAPARAQTTEIVLHSFAPHPPKGSFPFAGVIRDSAGNLYGTTGGFGTPSAGVVYKLNPNGHETVLYSFCSRSNVVGPHARGANHRASVLSQLDDLVSGWGDVLDVSADQAMAVRCALRALWRFGSARAARMF